MQDTFKRAFINYAPLVLFALAVIGIYAMYWRTVPRSSVVVYDCSISEISPDFPEQVKEACRKARMGKE